jgi:hypothetical protein
MPQCTSAAWTSLSKNRTNFRIGSCLNGADAEIRVSPDSQPLVMTPQLMQAIKLLQLSNLDLSAYVEAELERNPLLERANEAEDRSRAPSRKPTGDPRAATK